MKEIFFDEKKEILFLGRSNVGKSSIMNAIFEKKNMVKTSSRPGKTKGANIFLVENKYYFTDLPGYGFAKVSKSMQQELDGLISWYVEEKRSHIKKVILLIDAKIAAQKTDKEMYNFLNTLQIPVLIVLSKIDKLSSSEQKKSFDFVEKQFFGQDIIPVSALKKENIGRLKKYITQVLLSK